MAELKWVGPAGTGAAGEIPTVSDLTTKAATALTSTQVDSQISSALTGYSLKTYVDTQDTAKALKSYVDSQDATKILKTLKGAANGPVPLDGSGLIPKANITNTYPTSNKSTRGYYTPASYGVERQNVTTRDAFKMTADITIADPGFRYKIVPFGYWEASASDPGHQGWPEIRVKVGTEVIGWGRAPYNITEGNACQVMFYDPNDVTWTGAQTVTCWGGRNQWGNTSYAVNLWATASNPPKLWLLIVAA